MKVAIVIPAYNEEKYISGVIQDIQKESKEWTIIISDDGSTDKTVSQAKKQKVTVLTSQHNQGKGVAARKGCDYAYKNKFDTLILMDADGQHEAKDIKKLLKELKGKDIVFTYRVGSGQPLILKIGNWGLTFGTWLLFGLWIQDSQSGFRALTRKAYKQVRWKAQKYDMESEMIARSKKLQYSEVPIKKIYHDADKGTTVASGIRIAWKLLLWRLGL